MSLCPGNFFFLVLAFLELSMRAPSGITAYRCLDIALRGRLGDCLAFRPCTLVCHDAVLTLVLARRLRGYSLFSSCVLLRQVNNTSGIRSVQ